MRSWRSPAGSTPRWWRGISPCPISTYSAFPIRVEDTMFASCFRDGSDAGRARPGVPGLFGGQEVGAAFPVTAYGGPPPPKRLSTRRPEGGRRRRGFVLRSGEDK